jgi:HAD superfamily phosphoserine phosphatase-like hydrolase
MTSTDALHAFNRPFVAALTAALEGSAAEPRRVAVFDADGTLWDKDIGEAFFRWQLAAGKLKRTCGDRDIHAIYEEYEERVRQDRARGYAWIVQLMAGLRLRDVQAWSDHVAWLWPNYRGPMVALVAWLRQRGIETWIVSASNQWTVRSLSPYVGIDPEKALGIRTAVRKGIITDEIVFPLTCNEGKVETIRQEISLGPLLAFGDSMGDLEMLSHARHPMVVGQASAPNAALLDHARKHGWPVQVF